MTPSRPAVDKLLASRTRYRARSFRVNPRETLHRAWRYSVFVSIMKGMLPIVAIGLGIAVLSYVWQPRDSSRPVVTVENVGRIENDLAMVNPELNGADKDGLPFTVTAATAVPESLGSTRILLKGVDAKIALKSGGTMYVTAAQGIADTEKRLLDVSGGIHVTTSDGYDVTTESASADLGVGTIRGDQPIKASGKLGTITARRFAINKATGQIRFTGNVRTLLYGTGPKAGETPP
jgi:lipopolysaccharide export system protein LptC